MDFRKLLPYENYVLKTNLTVDEVLRRVADNTDQTSIKNSSFFGKRITKPYTGMVVWNSFTIVRNISYRNSFIPKITGEVSTSLGWTEVKIKMKLDKIVLVFISFWLGFVGIACLGIIVSELFQGEFPSDSLIPFGMFSFGYLLTYFGFKSESNQSKQFLKNILEGNEQY